MSIIGNKKIKFGNKYMEIIQSAFTTTGTTVSVSTSLSRVDAFYIGVLGTPDTGEDMSIDATANSDGTISPTSGAFTVTRKTGTTSGLKFILTLIGK